jgi:hypothetical protein
MTLRDDPARPASHLFGIRLDHHLHPTVTVGDTDDVEALEPDQQVAAVAVGGIGEGIRT